MKVKLSVVLFLCFSIANAYVMASASNLNEEIDKTVEIVKQQIKDRNTRNVDLNSLGIKVHSQEELKKVAENNKDLIETFEKAKKDAFAVGANGVSVFDDISIQKLKKSGEKKISQLKKQAEEDKIVTRFDTLIFISFDLDEQTLKQLYQINAGSKRTALVLRGLVKGTTTIDQTIIKIQKFAADLKLEVPPTVLLNPLWFKQYHVDKVPTIVYLKDKTPKKSGNFETGETVKAPEILSRVEGLIDPQYLYERESEGKTGNFGVKGIVANIGERDLIELMQERAATINFEDKKEKAIARAWNNIKIEPLEKATENRTRIIDPTVVISQDIVVDNPKKQGEKLYVARKGDVVNPLAIRPFDRLLVIFDPTDAKESQFVQDNLKTWKEKYKSTPNMITKLLVTNFDRDGGWNSYNELTDRLDEPVYILVPEIKKNFLLDKHPCVVYAKGLDFVVEEFKVE